MSAKRTKRDIIENEQIEEWKVLKIINRKHCLCRCSCGIERRVSSYHLLDGVSSRCKSCAQKVYDYGTVKDHPPRLRLLVNAAINRCYDKDHPRYHDWGGRGIHVYEKWLESRASFVSYLMTLEGWDKEGLILDREDNDKNYEPGNLRFVTPSVSNYNRRPYRTRGVSSTSKLS